MKIMTYILGFFLAALAMPALAEPPVFTSLTSAVDYSTAIAAILLVFAALAGVAIVWKGGKLILRALGLS